MNARKGLEAVGEFGTVVGEAVGDALRDHLWSD
jgi:hypothetical protein